MSSTSVEPRVPDGIDAEHIAEGGGRRQHASPVPVLVFGAIVVLGLTGMLGHERDWVAADGGASLTVHMPETIRNGEFMEMRLTVEADTEIDELVISIDHSLWEDLTINTMIPAPTDESSEDGEFRFGFGPLSADTSFLLKVDAQINPDIVGGNEGTITVYDGDTALVETLIEMAVLP